MPKLHIVALGIENGMFQIGKLSVASLTSTLGTAAIAANAVANTTSTFLNIPASAVGLAVLTVVGQCLGAGEKEQAVWYARRLLLLAYAGAWIMNLSAFFFADKLALTLFHLSPEAQAMALQVMQWFNIFVMCFNCVNYYWTFLIFFKNFNTYFYVCSFHIMI